MDTLVIIYTVGPVDPLFGMTDLISKTLGVNVLLLNVFIMCYCCFSNANYAK